MAASSGSVTWDLGEIKTRMTKLDADTDRAIDAIMSKKASDAQSHARANAPWTDRTSNARNGLMAQPFKTAGGLGRDAAGRFSRSSGVYGFVLFHSVPYGIWLEVRFSGRYAIIEPTIRKVGPETLMLVRNLLGRI